MPSSLTSLPDASSAGPPATGSIRNWRCWPYAGPSPCGVHPAGLIHHADRGSQYCSVEYQAELRKNGISISMSGKGNCFDNAMVETFFKTLKAELVWRTIFQSRIEAASAIGRYIDGFYNPVRRHSALNFISPLQFEGQAAKIENALHKCRESPP